MAGNPTAIAFSDDIGINVVPPPPPPGLAALVNFIHQLGNRARLGFGDVTGDHVADVLVGFNRTVVAFDGVSFNPVVVIPNALGRATTPINRVFGVDLTHDGRAEILVLTGTQVRIFAPTGQFLGAFPSRLLPILLGTAI